MKVYLVRLLWYKMQSQMKLGLSGQYGDPENFDLKTALSHKHNVGIDNIVIGEGIDGLLGYLVRLFVTKGITVVTTDGAYPTFNYHVTGFDGSPF